MKSSNILIGVICGCIGYSLGKKVAILKVNRVLSSDNFSEQITKAVVDILSKNGDLNSQK